MFQQEQENITLAIRSYCRKADLPDPGELNWSPIPFQGEWGISTNFFQLAAHEARRSNNQSDKTITIQNRAQDIAHDVAGYIGTPQGFTRVEAINGYLNLYFSPLEYSSRVIDRVLKEGLNYGCRPRTGERIMVEFSQPNTHKAFHVGHLRNVILGSAICNLLECAGNEVIRVNYIGDIGLHVIKWLWNYVNFHFNEEPGDDKTRWMGEIYSEADLRLEQHPEFEPQVRELFARWDNHDPEIFHLWSKTRQWSLEGFNQIYDLLDVKFDHIYFESEVEEPGKKLVEDLIARGIAKDERPEGPVIIPLDDLLGQKKEKYRVLVILRSDGTSLYATKDLPLAIKKFEEFNLDRSVYVIDVRQSLYLQQIYKTLEIMGYPWANQCYHLAYEIVNLPGNVTMSSRDGTVVLLEDLIREAKSRAYNIVTEKNPSLSDTRRKQISQDVALGAIKYTMLARDNIKIVTFDWNSALDFDGQAAPYIQYAHVRANSILRRYKEPLPKCADPDYKLQPTEIQLIDLISRIPGAIQRAAEEYKPIHITNLVYEIAKSFNDFYNQCPVIKAETEARDFRIRLVAASRDALASLLKILDIPTPVVM